MVILATMSHCLITRGLLNSACFRELLTGRMSEKLRYMDWSGFEIMTDINLSTSKILKGNCA